MNFKERMRIAVGDHLSEKVHRKAAEQSSAKQSELTRRVEKLEDENSELKKENDEMRSAYEQILRENSSEKFDERRVNFLKAQIIQLERQIMLQTDALKTREENLLTVENSLSGISKLCNGILQSESNTGAIRVARSDVNGILEAAEGAALRMRRSHEVCSRDHWRRPLTMMDRFLKTSQWTQVSLLDCCSGNIDHLNLKHVGKLESKLAALYRDVNKADAALSSLPCDVSDVPLFSVLPHEVSNNLTSQLKRCATSLRETSQELLQLSVLVPAAPWPALGKHTESALAADELLKKLPPFPRQRVQEGRRVLDGFTKMNSYLTHMHRLQKKAFDDQIKFNSAIYSAQLDYVSALLAAIKQGFSDFKKDGQRLVVSPLEDILACMTSLSSTAAETDLRRLLHTLKKNHATLEEARDWFKESADDDAIAVFESDFARAVERLRQVHSAQRTKLLDDIDLARSDYAKVKKEIQDMEVVSGSIKKSASQSSLSSDKEGSTGDDAVGVTSSLSNMSLGDRHQRRLAAKTAMREHLT